MNHFEKTSRSHFSVLNEHIEKTRNLVSASAAACYVICNDQIVNEWYSGYHDFSSNSRKVDEKSRFNVASVRKTYLGLLVSIALFEGKIHSVDDHVISYLPHLDNNIFKVLQFVIY